MHIATPKSSLPHRRGHNVCVSSLGFGLNDREIGVRFPAGTETSHSIQTGSGAHPNKIEDTSSERGAKGVWCWPVTGAEDKMRGDIPPFLNTSSWSGDELRTGATLACETWIPTAVRFLWNLTPCNTVEMNQRFGEICCFGFKVYPKDNKPHRGKRVFFSAKRSGGIWYPPKLFHRYRGLNSWGKSGRGVNMTTLLHLVPRLRMNKVIPPLPICLLDVHKDNYPTAGSSDSVTHT
jgi:hypothetical protein